MPRECSTACAWCRSECISCSTGVGVDAVSGAELSVHNQFQSLVRDLPQIEAALVIDAHGHPLASSVAFPVDRSQDFSDRDYFQSLKASGGGVYLSQVHTTPSGMPFFGWGEARIGPGGEFLGIVLVAISPNSLMQFYEKLVSEDRGLDGPHHHDDPRRWTDPGALSPHSGQARFRCPGPNPFFHPRFPPTLSGASISTAR